VKKIGAPPTVAVEKGNAAGASEGLRTLYWLDAAGKTEALGMEAGGAVDKCCAVSQD